MRGGVYYAEKHGYVPYIDFETDRCQYHVERSIYGTGNAWEYYFEQPTAMDPEALRRKKNVLLSGWTLQKKRGEKERVPEKWMRAFVHQVCPLKPYIKDLAGIKYREMFAPGQTLGVFLRGTDYVRLEPKGHPRQPSVEQIMRKMDEFIEKYPIKKIYVVTEDGDIFEKIKGRYGDKVFASDDNFVKNYDGTDYIDHSFSDDPYMRGLNYLIRLVLLAECDYLISSLASGSQYTRLLRESKYKEMYLFDLGCYGDGKNSG